MHSYFMNSKNLTDISVEDNITILREQPQYHLSISIYSAVFFVFKQIDIHSQSSIFFISRLEEVFLSD